eukprot:TRINITY_DN28197_c1_g1_i1.p1 TRINITY_DN28197_c1_g1~~TRINITY_DN28197_c1_g1_i1.p1  ORF type:complete len:301 (-),score=45.16 TRINITY_DN28197_c1_g1_i1:233-1135(-)
MWNVCWILQKSILQLVLKKTEAQIAAYKAQLKKKLPTHSENADQLLEIASQMQAVESVNLLSNTPSNKFIGINMYVDDEGLIKGLPLNVRATSLAQTCGLAIHVYGDAFLARFMDSDAEFERMDFTLSEVSSSAEWVQLAKKQQLERSQGDSGLSVLNQMAQNQQKQPQGNTVKIEEVSPAEDHKEKGNRYFIQDKFELAVEEYTKAVELDSSLISALNNRALARLKLAHYPEAIQDADLVLMQEQNNVKALLRRGSAHRSMGEKEKAKVDYEQVLRLESNNSEAQKKLLELEQPDEETI